MLEIVEWTTQDIEFALKDEHGDTPAGMFDSIKDVSITIRQGRVAIEKAISDISIDAERGVMAVHLAQTETGRLKGGTRNDPKTASIQVNIYYANGERDASYEAQVAVLRNLHDRAMR